MVVTKALFWTDIVTVFGLLVTDFGPGCYDHLNYNHLSAVHTGAWAHGLQMSTGERGFEPLKRYADFWYQIQGGTQISGSRLNDV